MDHSSSQVLAIQRIEPALLMIMIETIFKDSKLQTVLRELPQL